MSNGTLCGPFLTRREAARRAGISETLLVRRPDLLRLGGRHLEEVYFAFQFDEAGVRPDVGGVVSRLKPDYDDIDICHWLVAPQEDLGRSTPLNWIVSGRPARDALGCAAAALASRRAIPRVAVEPDEDSGRPVATRKVRRRRHRRPRAAAVSSV